MKAHRQRHFPEGATIVRVAGDRLLEVAGAMPLDLKGECGAPADGYHHRFRLLRTEAAVLPSGAPDAGESNRARTRIGEMELQLLGPMLLRTIEILYRVLCHQALRS